VKRTPLKKTNPKRRAASFDRAYGSTERVEWVQRQPCVNCGKTPSENAHVRTGGTSRKADACWIAPLCAVCHADLHQFGIKTFQTVMGLDLDHEAAITDARWEVSVAKAQQKTPAPDTLKARPK